MDDDLELERQAAAAFGATLRHDVGEPIRPDTSVLEVNVPGGRRRGFVIIAAAVLVLVAVGAVVAMLMLRRTGGRVTPASPSVTTPSSETAPGAAVSSDVVAGLRARPIVLPHLAASQTCPVTTVVGAPSADLAAMLGDGPARPVGIDPVAGIDLVFGTTEFGNAGWGGAKVLWALSEADGPALVRGRQLDGDAQVRFDSGADPATEKVLDPTGAAPLAGGWVDFPGYTRLQAPGCYGYQVDTPTGTTTVVFTANTGPATTTTTVAVSADPCTPGGPLADPLRDLTTLADIDFTVYSGDDHLGLLAQLPGSDQTTTLGCLSPVAATPADGLLPGSVIPIDGAVAVLAMVPDGKHLALYPWANPTPIDADESTISGLHVELYEIPNDADTRIADATSADLQSIFGAISQAHDGTITSLSLPATAFVDENASCVPTSPADVGGCAWVDWDYIGATDSTITIRVYLNSPGCAETIDRIDIDETDTTVNLTAIAKYTGGKDLSCPTALATTEKTVQLDGPVGARTLTGCRPTNSFAPSGGYEHSAPRDQPCRSTSSDQPVTTVGQITLTLPAEAGPSPMPVPVLPDWVVAYGRWSLADQGSLTVAVQSQHPLFPDWELVSEFDANGLHWQIYDVGPEDGSITSVYAPLDDTHAVLIGGQSFNPDSNEQIRDAIIDAAKTVEHVP